MLSGKQIGLRDFTPSHEHYLRAIYAVRSRRGYARLTDIARELQVAPATLSVGIKPLVLRGFVTHDDQRFLLLTPEGERLAREVHHRFAVTHAFLRDVLGIPDDRARVEACLLEHDIGAATTDRLLDLVRLLREDQELRMHFQQRFAAYHRSCRPPAECAMCDLTCTAGDTVTGP